MPKNDVEWVITPSGTLKLSWLKKIAEYKGNDRVTLIYKGKSTNKTTEVEGIAKEIKVQALKFADEYEVILQDKMSGEENYTFFFTACKFFT